ncbi:hypothetical protein QUA20_18480 [Microcoleus sp. Pol7_A1]|uniref:hypothetical protein n=1 Tax=unclassified Microcoleus TaxID=2642155 RepID=UPI002FD4B9AE
MRNHPPASSSLNIQLPTILLESGHPPVHLVETRFAASAPKAVKSHHIVTCHPIGSNLKIKVV